MTLSEPPLLPDQRRERLLADLHAHGTLRVSEIARALGVTTVTVRRDIAQLADEGAIERVHGGIRLPRNGDGQPPFSVAIAEPGRSTGADEASLPAVGMVVPSLDYYWPEIVRGARDAAPDAGVRIVLRGSSYDDVADVRRQTAWLLETAGIQGLLIAPPTIGDEAAQLIDWLAGLDIPVVFVERTATVGLYQEHVESVSTDHAFGASLAVRHLAARGHRRVGFLASASSPHTPAVRRGWQQTAAAIGLELDAPELISPDHRDPRWDAEIDRGIDAWTASGTTALLAHSDREAISLVARCEERGIRVPGDLAVVAFDDEVAGLANPALSAVRPAKYTIGESAMQLLSKRIQDPARPVHRVLISPQLIVRDSSGARP
ncbi:substrate-binding domain-containing protein [Catellatospora citrea]|uniref:LacI family transcriptional regulator n=1 Tax=Catellatospora citrea TaxID=53366 RepID=A0A8J3KIY0_9ACTN|nr:substrate-binding domain-containing protein [Catellatospora citrea]RKE11346.1 GntR family transcriptional regulator [Catellatospora citrea]GIF96814.1 LacI family transcriptional regulator [Catellatospora citrea]